MKEIPKKMTKIEEAQIVSMKLDGLPSSMIESELGIKATTIDSFWARHKDDKEWDELKEEKNKRIKEAFTRITSKAQLLLEKRLDKALSNEEAIDAMIEGAKASGFPNEDVKRICARLKDLKIESNKDLTIMMGTAFDKKVVCEDRMPGSTSGLTFVEDMSDDEECFGQ